MSILKVGVLVVAGVLLAVQFKNGKTEYSTYISVVLGILIFGGILGYLEILIHAFDKLEEDLDLDYAYVAILKCLELLMCRNLCLQSVKMQDISQLHFRLKYLQGLESWFCVFRFL